MKNKIGFYPGSFDPPTLGHLWVVRQGASLFEKLYVGVGKNPNKEYLFSMKERANLLSGAVKDFSNVEVVEMGESFQYEIAKKLGVGFLFYGERDEKDALDIHRYFEFHEKKQVDFASLKIIAPKKIKDISASVIKDLIKKNDVKLKIKMQKYLPKISQEAVLKKLNLN